LRRRQSLQDDHRAAALGAGPGGSGRRSGRAAIFLPGLWFWCGWQIGRSSQELEAKGQERGAPSLGQKAEMTDADEARGKHVKQKAAQEFLDRQGHQALLVAVRGVSPAKGDLVALEGDQAVIGDGHAVGVAAEITENVLGATEGRFAVDHPVLTEKRSEESSESLRFRQKLEVPVEAELAFGEGPFESVDKLAAEDSPQHFDGEKEAIARGDPALVIGGEAAGRNHAM